MLIYFTFNTIIELLCFITALVCLRHQRSFVWKGWIFFLLITVFAEMSGIYLWKEYRLPNAWIYNILMTLQAFFFIGMFRHFIYPDKQSIPLITIGSVLFVVVYIADTVRHKFFPVNQGDFDGYNSMANTTLGIILVFYSLYYFYRLLNEEISTDFTLNAAFWWVAGTLFFYFGSLITSIFYEVLKLKGISTSYIFNILIAVLYGCWCYAFILKRWVDPTLDN